MSEQDVFRYPTAHGMLASVEDYGRLFLPAMHDLNTIAPRMQSCIALARRHLGERGQWLDYGCGGGVFAWHAGRAFPNWEVLGIDGDYSSLEIARRFFSSGNVAYERQHYSALNTLSESRFDVISLLEVIEHVLNPGEFVSAMARALKPGGFFLASTPNFVGPLSINDEWRRMVNELIGRRRREAYVRLLNERAYDPTTDSGHVVVYSLQTLTRLLASAGLELADFVLAPGRPGLLHRLWPETLIVLGRKKQI